MLGNRVVCDLTGHQPKRGVGDGPEAHGGQQRTGVPPKEVL